MPKLLNEKDFSFEIKKKYKNFEVVKSCNKNHCVTNDTKLIIVGTITPPKGAGYFYTAPRNKIYGYIDQAINTKLKEKKLSLLQKPNNKEIINDIKQILINNKIAFLDIIQYAIRKKESPYDKDILYYTLDIDCFNINKNALYICNSIFAKECFEKICNILNIKLNYIYLSQRLDTKKSWVETIKKILNIDN